MWYFAGGCSWEEPKVKVKNPEKWVSLQKNVVLIGNRLKRLTKRVRRKCSDIGRRRSRSLRFRGVYLRGLLLLYLWRTLRMVRGSIHSFVREMNPQWTTARVVITPGSDRELLPPRSPRFSSVRSVTPGRSVNLRNLLFTVDSHTSPSGMETRRLRLEKLHL